MTFEIDLENSVPERLVGLEKRHEVVPTRIVDDDLDRTELLGDLLDRRLHGLCVRHIDGDGDCLASSLADGSCGLLGDLEVEVGDCNAKARVTERVRDSLADALRATGDECDSIAHDFTPYR